MDPWYTSDMWWVRVMGLLPDQVRALARFPILAHCVNLVDPLYVSVLAEFETKKNKSYTDRVL